ncbi:zinc finger MYM-type protein 1-like [Dioscorea cayenensis subsp. rotundata]|uniref:Zinc finger MYM-type protein 1-like n=1 Tax=Dioscorea cayennensis subsp. rotundata TaxID=55577 RepID=A0AB40B4B8_DIOCR|nr:zinc finger MYM-type protein 1-like [Dioscorea cayenensis subsp. rotundata]
MEVEYRTHLTAVLDVTCFLLRQGLPFCGHDESLSSLNKGNFHELLEWYSLRNDKVFRVVNQNDPANNQMTSSKIQKELANACATKITCAIVDDIGDKYFSLMIDETQDVSVKEQMGVVLRYVSKNGYVIESFLAMVHVPDTSVISLKNAIDCLFAKHRLSLSRLRGQGYDGASNMRGEFNGLKALVLKENPYARYIHCFAHQLQLVIVDVAKDNRIVSDFFQYVTMIVNAAGALAKGKNNFGNITMTGNTIPVPNMEDHMRIRGRSRREGQVITHFHHYRIEIFCEVIDLIAQEMQNRFPETSTELLLLLSCLDPRDSFSKFNIHKLLRLAELYPEDFTMTERMMLEDQLATFIYDVRHDPDFINVGELGGFARKMVETGKHIIFPLIYLLIELALVLPIVTASVERVFSAMNIVKTDLCNKMGDEWMNDSLVVYIEREVFATIDNEAILQRFQKMQTRRMQLPPLSLTHMPHISSTNAGIGSSSSMHK